MKPAALLNIACGGCNGDLSRYGGVKLLMPSGYSQFFSDLELPKAIQDAAQFNCYAAAVAAIYALAPPFELILQANAAIILEVCHHVAGRPQCPFLLSLHGMEVPAEGMFCTWPWRVFLVGKQPHVSHVVTEIGLEARR